MADDVEIIKNLVHSYAELLDTGDLRGLSELFAGATPRTHGAPGELQRP